MTAVSKTPNVDRITPGQATALVSFQLVSRPPEKMIKIRAMTPIDFANCALSKWIPPIPSEPASIPITKNNNNVGIANLSESLLETALTNISTATHNKIVSIGII